MIKEILTYYTAYLNEYLGRKHPQPEGVAEVGFIGGNTDEKPCKLIVSLINIERETSGGILNPVQRGRAEYIRKNPPLVLNLDLILAAVYDEKHYTEALSVLSDVLEFIQTNPTFDMNGQMYTVEIVTLSPQDINTIWTTLGGQYYPSVTCKLRRIIVDSGEIKGSGKSMKQPNIDF